MPNALDLYDMTLNAGEYFFTSQMSNAASFSNGYSEGTVGITTFYPFGADLTNVPFSSFRIYQSK